jgi:hypothetical protein
MRRRHRNIDRSRGSREDKSEDKKGQPKRRQRESRNEDRNEYRGGDRGGDKKGGIRRDKKKVNVNEHRSWDRGGDRWGDRDEDRRGDRRGDRQGDRRRDGGNQKKDKRWTIASDKEKQRESWRDIGRKKEADKMTLSRPEVRSELVTNNEVYKLANVLVYKRWRARKNER